ncbi:hypothetical protein FPV67DRAFT_1494385, partial [Lyophyllum atratum]
MRSYSCRCLNVRFESVDDNISRVLVTHPRLIDLLLKAEGSSGSRIYLVCFLCGFLTLDCPLRQGYQVDHRLHTRVLEFEHAAFESVSIPDNHINPQRMAKICLTDTQRLAAANSPAFSSTFRVVLSPDIFVHPKPAINRRDPLLLDTYPTQLSQVFSDLCDVVLKRSLRLRADELLARHQVAEPHVDIALEERKMRSEFRLLCRMLWDRYHQDFSPKNDKLFDSAIQPYMAKIDASFWESSTATGIQNASTSMDVDLMAITLEGVTFDRFHGVENQALLAPTSQGPTFNDLPTETAWKILDFLRPTYTAIDLLSVQSYRVQCCSFAQLMFVSKSWSEMVPPLLYHTLVLFANPHSLNKLVAVLRSYGSLVRTIIIDGVALGSDDDDMHIQSCREYIDQCLKHSINLRHVECYGDYQVALRDVPKLRSQSQIQNLVLRLPLWLPFDVCSAIGLSPSSLERLEISQWRPHALQPVLDPATCPRLPRCRTIDLRESSIGADQVSALLSLATENGQSSLRDLSLIDMSFDAPAILEVLHVNEISTYLTTLRIQLPHSVQHGAGIDFPFQVLPLCPSLTEFSYTSPTSAEVFHYLPPSLRA